MAKTTTTTKTAKQTKQVTVIARVVFKADTKRVCYLVRSSNGKDQYQTCLFDGKATGCTCPATKPCYHMFQVEKLEAARTVQASSQAAPAEQVTPPTMSEANLDYIAKLDPTHPETANTIDLLSQYAAATSERKPTAEQEAKAHLFAFLKQQFDYRSAAPVAPASIATRGTLNPQKAFSLLR